jgi:hypothetical protein
MLAAGCISIAPRAEPHVKDYGKAPQAAPRLVVTAATACARSMVLVGDHYG